MGILNITPDSFYDGSKKIFTNHDELNNKINEFKYADIIDVGCESSKPGSKPISEKEEIERLSKIISVINKERVFSIALVEPFTIQNGLLTQTLKQKREKIIQRDLKLINEIYGL